MEELAAKQAAEEAAEREAIAAREAAEAAAAEEKAEAELAALKVEEERAEALAGARPAPGGASETAAARSVEHELEGSVHGSSIDVQVKRLPVQHIRLPSIVAV
jgi:hypothetical protein